MTRVELIGASESIGSPTQAYLDGSIAALRKQPATNNPHPLGSSVSRAWARGHREITEARA